MNRYNDNKKGPAQTRMDDSNRPPEWSRPVQTLCDRCSYKLIGEDAIRNHPARCPGRRP